ncbi:MAG: hypothetical protein VX519_10910 [Myxococcota bacterium]|nr:hypothetical protein [Myxococcota bacterium]
MRWRERLEDVLDPLGRMVFRANYGDEVDLAEVSKITGVDQAELQSSREGVRGALRSILRSDSISMAQSDVRQLDALLVRLACLPRSDCRGGSEVLEAGKRDHVDACSRCGRAARLIRGGVLAPSDLVAPDVEAGAVLSHTSVLALHLHPDARQHRDVIYEALGSQGVRADDDTLMIHPDRVGDLPSVLWELAQRGTPMRHHIRGARVRGPGRWSDAALLGPVATAAVELTRSRQWGEIDDVGALPKPFPAPPASGHWWVIALLLACFTVIGAVLTFGGSEQGAVYPLQASFSRSEGWVAARFDAPDDAWLLAVVEGELGLELIHLSRNPSDKGELATGVGDYQLRWPGKRMLLATIAVRPEEMQPLLRSAASSEEPLDDFAQRLQARYPGTGLRLQHSDSKEISQEQGR